jgi:hypothetical protein
VVILTGNLGAFLLLKKMKQSACAPFGLKLLWRQATAAIIRDQQGEKFPCLIGCGLDIGEISVYLFCCAFLAQSASHNSESKSQIDVVATRIFFAFVRYFFVLHDHESTFRILINGRYSIAAALNESLSDIEVYR